MLLINSLPKRSPIYLPDAIEERTRIARELHDGIAQDLAAIGYALDAEIGRSDTTEHSRKSLRGIRAQVTLLNSKVRNEIFQLRSPRTPEPHTQLERSLEFIGISFSLEGQLPTTEVGLELFKIIQELARNAKEHGAATNISITCTPTRVTIKHNGQNDDTKKEGRLGIQGITERLANIGWHAHFENGYSHIEISEKI